MNDLLTNHPAKRFSGKNLAAVAFIVLVFVLGLGVSPKSEASKGQDNSNEPQLEGTWFFGDLTDPIEPKFLETYNAGGGVQVIGTLAYDGSATEGHGGWVRKGNRTYAAKIYQLLQKHDGTYDGTLIMEWHDIIISKDGKSMTINGLARLLDAHGVEVGAFPVDVSGKRVNP